MAGMQQARLLALAFSLSACGDYSYCTDGQVQLLGWCVGETGDAEPLEYFYDQHGIALLLDPDSERAQQIIDEGWFHPHGQGMCEQPLYEWTAFTEYRSEGEIRMSCCADLGCQWSPPTLPNTAESFGLCYPDAAAWSLDGLIGALAPINEYGVPDCASIDSLGWQFPYLYPVYCEFGIVCEEQEYMTSCGCRCGSDQPCWQLDNYLEAEYFGQDVLADAGWESLCTGVPYWWDDQAYGTGGWVGGSCEFNQPGPGPVPLVPDTSWAIASLVTCDDHTCLVPQKALDLALAHPGVFDGILLSPEGGEVLVAGCNDLCYHLGGAPGLQIIGIGVDGADPTEPANVFAAFTEFSRQRYSEVHTNVGVFSFYLEN